MKRNYVKKTKTTDFLKKFNGHIGRIAGYRLLLLIFITFLAGLFDGFGLMMFMPLLGYFGNHETGHAGSQNFIEHHIHRIGLTDIRMILFLIVGIFFLKYIFTSLRYIYEHYLGKIIYRKATAVIIQKWSDDDYQNIGLKKSSGYFTNVLGTAIWSFVACFRKYCILIMQFIYIGIYLAFCLTLNYYVTITACIAGIFALFFLKQINRTIKRYSHRFVDINTKYQTKIIEFVSGFKYLIATNQYHKIGSLIRAQNRKLSSIRFKQGVLQSMTATGAEPLCVILTLFVFYYLVVLRGMSFQSTGILLIFFYRITMKAAELQGSWQKFIAGSGGAEMTMEVLENHGCEEITEERNAKITLNNFKDRIDLKDISFSYNNSILQLHEVSAYVGKGEAIALVGASGSGKTTLIDVMSGVILPDSGEITIDNYSYSDINKRSLGKMIGYVPQEPVMFHDTVFNNICMWSASKDDQDALCKVNNVLKSAYCDEFISQLPKGVHTVLDDRGRGLSVGERQRLAIARELYRLPEILFLDEVTSALDVVSENYIQRTIKDLKGNMTIVMIAHRLSTIRNVDRVYVLEKGRIKEAGSFNDLYLDEQSTFFKMCKSQEIIYNK